MNAAKQVYALLADGTTVEIRPAGPGDFDAVKAMHEAMSSDNIYMRFFNVSRLAAETEARRICRDPAPGQVALLALASDEMVGVASYVALGKGNAEVAFAVADHMHHKGIATLLLRVSRLSEDLPEVTDLDLDPVVAGPALAVVNARVKVTPYEPRDPFLRKLR